MIQAHDLGQETRVFPRRCLCVHCSLRYEPPDHKHQRSRNTSSVLPVRKFTVTQARTPKRRNKGGWGGCGKVCVSHDSRSDYNPHWLRVDI